MSCKLPTKLPASKDELLALKLKVDEDIASISLQIAEAKARAATTGDYSDRSWFLKANHAQRYYGQYSQRIQIELSRVKKEEKEKNIATNQTFERCFIEVARERLLDDFFSEIVEEAKYRAGLKKPSITDSLRTGEFA